MDGNERRKKIIELLKEYKRPVSGSEFSRLLGVSRQVIVQDIALLRAVERNILSTNQGYLLFEQDGSRQSVKMTVCVKHETHQIRDELYSIVDIGGRVVDVVVAHPIYGQITADLLVRNRDEADQFAASIERERTRPLKELTDGVHYHTIEADSRDALDRIQNILKEKGYLLK